LSKVTMSDCAQPKRTMASSIAEIVHLVH